MHGGGGGFNAIKNHSERIREVSHVNKSEIEEFTFIDNVDLIDVLVVGCRFTWCKNNGGCMSRLNRFLLSNRLISRWRMVGQMVRGDLFHIIYQFGFLLII